MLGTFQHMPRAEKNLAEPAPAMTGLLPCWAHYTFHRVEAVRLQVAPADGAVICNAAVGGEHVAVSRILQQSPASLHGRSTTSSL